MSPVVPELDSAVAVELKANAANLAELMQLYAKGVIKPLVSERYPLARAGEAIARLAARQAMGKIVVTMD